MIRVVGKTSASMSKPRSSRPRWIAKLTAAEKQTAAIKERKRLDPLRAYKGPEAPDQSCSHKHVECEQRMTKRRLS